MPEMELILSTGYRVEINPEHPVDSFVDLSRALLCEIFLKVLDDKGEVGLGFHATMQEISTLVNQLEVDDACAVLKVALWARFLEEHEKVRKGLKRREKK